MDYAQHCPKLPWMVDFFSTESGTVPKGQRQAVYAKTQLDYLSNLNFESKPAKKRLTGIICTLGPKTSDAMILEKMIHYGMCVARLKLPFFTRTECETAIENVRSAADNYSKRLGTLHPIAIAVDLRGPEIRTGILKDVKPIFVLFKRHKVVSPAAAGPVELLQGHETMITTDPSFEEHVTENMIYVDYQKINEIIEPGDRFCLDNKITLSALEIVGSFIRCIIEKAGRIGDRVSVSLEGSILDLPTVSELEVQYAKELQVDVIFVSAVKDKEVIHEIKNMLGEDGQAIMVVAKIENEIGAKNIESILEVADGVLLSRNDLAHDMRMEKLFLVQKKIIALCNKAGKPVIVSPQMLESMSNKSEPKGSEMLDVANAVLDGADALMLSRETATGDYPIESVRILSKICREAESATYQRQVFSDLAAETHYPFEPIYSLAIGVVEASLKSAAAAIILLTTSGRTAKVISRFRPRCPIIAITRFARVARQLKMFRAVEPLHFIKKPLRDYQLDSKTRIQFGITYGKLKHYIRAGDAIIVVTGSRAGTGFTNCMHIYYASDFDTVDEVKI